MSFNAGLSLTVAVVQVGLEVSGEFKFLRNISQYTNKVK